MESSGRREEVKAELPCSIKSGKLSLWKAGGFRSSSHLARRREKGRSLGRCQTSAKFFFPTPLFLSSLKGGLMVLRSVVSGRDFFSETSKKQPQHFAGERSQELPLPRQRRSWGSKKCGEASPCTRIAALIARLTSVVWLNTILWKPVAALCLSHQGSHSKV